MNLSKFRRWDINANQILLSAPMGITESQLLDKDFRRDNRITLATSCNDKYGIEIYEGDVLRVYYPGFEMLSEDIRIGSDKLPVYGYIDYYAPRNDFGLWTNYSRSLIDLKQHNPTYEIISNFYENQRWLSLTGSLLESSKWKL